MSEEKKKLDYTTYNKIQDELSRMSKGNNETKQINEHAARVKREYPKVAKQSNKVLSKIL